ncbi:MAG: hypothetical protein KBA51_05815 [Kiritimatiellae bacterium]|nr:hypothetical protein [Kiritimatiellia bacterium]
MPQRLVSNKRWLIWLLVVIALIGTLLGYLFSLEPNNGQQSAYLAWAVTGALVGIIFIIYTADHWLSR